MTKTKYTLGPWIVEERDNNKLVPTFTILGKTKTGHDVYVGKADLWNDACLMASALKLLAACRAAVELLESQMTEAQQQEHTLDCAGPDSCVLCQLKAAIEQAEPK